MRLADVARLELGAGDYTLRSQLDNKDAVAIPIFEAPGANAIELSDAVRAKMAELATRFPEGMTYDVVYDPTVFVRDSISAVVTTLFEAVLLVVLVVILFLQTWRASIIPLLAVPVSIVGTFAALHLLGFSINTLTLVRSRARDRHRRRRRDRRGRERRAQHRGGQIAARGGAPGHARGLGPDHRDRARALRRVRADVVPDRRHGPVLQAVRRDHRDLDGDLGDQLADPVAGARGRAAEAARRAQGRADAR